jgi:hypothetical protein
MRKGWAEGWNRRLKCGGHLIALQYPVVEPGQDGPPWPVSFDAYEEVLQPCGFECVLREDVAPALATKEGRQGREIFTVWRKA